MGFEGKKTLRLKFEDPELEGLEVIAHRPAVGRVLDAKDRTEELGADERAAVRAAAELLCDCLVSWNLENDGEPVEHTADALLDQDEVVVSAILDAWQDNLFVVPGPKEPSSNGGEPSPAVSIPMEPLSESLAS